MNDRRVTTIPAEDPRDVRARDLYPYEDEENSTRLDASWYSPRKRRPGAFVVLHGRPQESDE